MAKEVDTDIPLIQDPNNEGNANIIEFLLEATCGDV
jgi:hypothetical protein